MANLWSNFKEGLNMKKIMRVILLLALSISSVMSADYRYIDAGEHYYINKFGSNNEYVQVIRKVGNNKVKVKDVIDGSTEIVHASKLLTRKTLKEDESTNKIIGVAATAAAMGALYCYFNPKECKIKK